MINKISKVLGIVSCIVSLGLNTSANAGGTNCWGVPIIKHKLDRVLISSDRCEKPIFRLTKGEVSRNIRLSPNGLRIAGQMNEVGDYSLFESRLIATYDDGKTYWAFGEAFSERNPNKRIKGWVEVGNTKAIVQYDLPGVNDVWFRF